ncbi:dihydrodipicolinate synthase family protein [Nitratireductor mangrovi]|uniref:Dihydrodipicolinate synthase family protein n=1 Tax=Nitratireductor mangrovi TaxID=2599600 RepID=A0A5B8L3G1_9HYPH|nr:dihydrodipicolinate synthase family protein [Nitratireductor mangrovi]QDZ02312.1 dihydrodipicolinate synthase family protein [Nitratireductor mangrovi]
MPRKSYDCSGVIPACLLPLHDDLSIDEKSYRKHLRDVAGVKGVAAITVNGHASEVSSCTFEEQEMLLASALDEIGDKVPLVNGVYSDGGTDAVRIARMADQKGASALLVFPSNVFILGSRPEMILDHYRRIADATDLPLIIFQFPSNTPLGYSHEVLARLIEEIPSIKAMKDGCGDPARHEMTVRELQSDSRPFHVLSTHSAWLLSSLVNGCNGLLSGAGSTIADLQVQLFDAVKGNDLAKAKEVAARIYPTTSAFYGAPGVDMHNRMKEAQVILGRLPNAAVRPPLQKLGDAEIERIRKAMQAARITAEGALPAAA